MLEFKDFLNESSDGELIVSPNEQEQGRSEIAIWIKGGTAYRIRLSSDGKLSKLNSQEKQTLADEIAKKVEALVIRELKKANM